MWSRSVADTATSNSGVTTGRPIRGYGPIAGEPLLECNVGGCGLLT